MNRIALIFGLLLAGCLPGGAVTHDFKAPVGALSVTELAAAAPPAKALAMAAVTRKVAAGIRSGELKSVADVQDFEKTQMAGTASVYAALVDAQDARLAKDSAGNLQFVAGPDGNPDLEATAKIWDETADGFERAGKGK